MKRPKKKEWMRRRVKGVDRTEQAVDVCPPGQRGRCHMKGGAHGVSGLDTPELQKGIVWSCLAKALE